LLRHATSQTNALQIQCQDGTVPKSAEPLSCTRLAQAVGQFFVEKLDFRSTSICRDSMQTYMVIAIRRACWRTILGSAQRGGNGESVLETDLEAG